jgi:hypothetical protein
MNSLFVAPSLVLATAGCNSHGEKGEPLKLNANDIKLSLVTHGSLTTDQIEKVNGFIKHLKKYIQLPLKKRKQISDEIKTLTRKSLFGSIWQKYMRSLFANIRVLILPENRKPLNWFCSYL